MIWFSSSFYIINVIYTGHNIILVLVFHLDLWEVGGGIISDLLVADGSVHTHTEREREREREIKFKTHYYTLHVLKKIIYRQSIIMISWL